MQVLCVRDVTRLCWCYCVNCVMTSSCALNVKPLTYTQTGGTFKSECSWKQRCRNHTLHSHILKQVCYSNQNPPGKTRQTLYSLKSNVCRGLYQLCAIFLLVCGVFNYQLCTLSRSQGVIGRNPVGESDLNNHKSCSG